MSRLHLFPCVGCVVLSALAFAQNTGRTATLPEVPQASTGTTKPSPVPPRQDNDQLSQMRTDLNRMESLNLNMSSEIEFLHDQNLQILLRTNSQMWTILIHDLQRQIEREEQRQSRSPATQK